MKNVLLLTLVGLIAIGSLSCGGKSNAEKLCDILIEKIYANCDVATEPTDAAALAIFYSTLTGDTITADQIAQTSEGEAVNLCTDGVNDYEDEVGVETTSEYVDAAEVAIGLIPDGDCEEVLLALGGLLPT